jgi:hypothetical protein
MSIAHEVEEATEGAAVEVGYGECCGLLSMPTAPRPCTQRCLRCNLMFAILHSHLFPPLDTDEAINELNAATRSLAITDTTEDASSNIANFAFKLLVPSNVAGCLIGKVRFVFQLLYCQLTIAAGALTERSVCTST